MSIVGGNPAVEFAKRQKVHSDFWLGDDLKIYIDARRK
jgi:hypothetical protein